MGNGLRLLLVLAIVGAFAAVAFMGGKRDEFVFVSASGPLVANAQALERLQNQLDELRKQVADHPTDYAAHAKLANALFNYASLTNRMSDIEKKEWKEAAQEYLEALKGGDSPDLRSDLGTCYFQLGQYDDALREFKTVLAAHPDHANSAFNVGMTLEAKGDTAGAIQQWEELARTQPGSKAGQQAMANVLRLKK